MTLNESARRQILDEDLQIVRATLAAINDDVRRFSSEAADSLKEAVERLDRARRAFSIRRPLSRRVGGHPEA